MDRNTAVTTWRDVCGSDTVMAMGLATGRMLEEFARRIEAAERERMASKFMTLAKAAHDAGHYSKRDELSACAGWVLRA